VLPGGFLPADATLAQAGLDLISLFGVDIAPGGQWLLALATVLGLLAIMWLVLRNRGGGRLRLGGASNQRNRQPRLGVVDMFDLDRQRKLVLIRRDNVEHLVLLGGSSDVVVESNIQRGAQRAAAPPATELAFDPLPPMPERPAATEKMALAPAAAPVATIELPQPTAVAAMTVTTAVAAQSMTAASAAPTMDPKPLPDMKPLSGATPKPAQTELDDMTRQLEEALKRPFAAVRPSSAATSQPTSFEAETTSANDTPKREPEREAPGPESKAVEPKPPLQASAPPQASAPVQPPAPKPVLNTKPVPAAPIATPPSASPVAPVAQVPQVAPIASQASADFDLEQALAQALAVPAMPVPAISAPAMPMPAAPAQAKPALPVQPAANALPPKPTEPAPAPPKPVAASPASPPPTPAMAPPATLPPATPPVLPPAMPAKPVLAAIPAAAIAASMATPAANPTPATVSRPAPVESPAPAASADENDPFSVALIEAEFERLLGRSSQAPPDKSS
jgi:flagellar protein FliO/FliZ